MAKNKNNLHFLPRNRKKVWKHEEQISLWRKQYMALRKQMELGTEEDELLGNTPLEPIPEKKSVMRERRRDPRFNFQDNTTIYAHMGPKAFALHDISIGGVAFYSDLYFAQGTTLLLSALGMVALDVEVLHSSLKLVDAHFMEYQYLIHAQFSERVNGYLVYVLARELYTKGNSIGKPSLPQRLS